MERWEGKVAVVTGATSGIGAAICTELCRAGMIVNGLSRRKDKVEALRILLINAKGTLNAIECDITHEGSVKAAYMWVEKQCGGIDLLVNNAEVFSKCMLLDPDNTKDLRLMMESNLIALCICTREAIKSMRARQVKHGHVVNINSIFGHKVNTCVPGTKPINGLYPACKYAMTAMTECLRQEVNYLDLPVKVSNISPGLTENDILTTKGIDNNELVQYMPRLKPEEVAKALMFVICTPPDVLVQDIVLKPVGEFL